MKQRIIASSILLIVIAIAINISFKKKSSSICMANITVLTQDEEPVQDYWCCGTTSTCIEHAEFKIVGKLQDKPCGK